MPVKPLSAIFDRRLGLGLVCEVSRGLLGEGVNTLVLGLRLE